MLLKREKRENYSDFLLTDIFLNLFQSLTCEKYFLRRCQNSQTDEQITKGPVGKQKQIGL